MKVNNNALLLLKIRLSPGVDNICQRINSGTLEEVEAEQ
jgi:hypothetical protein